VKLSTLLLREGHRLSAFVEKEVAEENVIFVNGGGRLSKRRLKKIV